MFRSSLVVPGISSEVRARESESCQRFDTSDHRASRPFGCAQNCVVSLFSSVYSFCSSFLPHIFCQCAESEAVFSQRQEILFGSGLMRWVSCAVNLTSAHQFRLLCTKIVASTGQFDFFFFLHSFILEAFVTRRNRTRNTKG